MIPQAAESRLDQVKPRRRWHSMLAAAIDLPSSVVIELLVIFLCLELTFCVQVWFLMREIEVLLPLSRGGAK